MPEAKYKAFISYSHRDDKWATWLHRALETYKPPTQLVGTETKHGKVPARLSPIFRDREEHQRSPRAIGLPDSRLLAGRREVEVGQRGDPGLQAPRRRRQDLLPDRRR